MTRAMLSYKKIKLSNYKWTTTLSIDEYKTILKKCAFVIETQAQVFTRQQHIKNL